MLLNVKITAKQKEELKNIAGNFGYNLSAYVKRKLFNENQDFDQSQDIYLNPSFKKNNLLIVTMLCKMFYITSELLKKQGVSIEEIAVIEKQSLEYARKLREKQGYKIIPRKAGSENDLKESDMEEENG